MFDQVVKLDRIMAYKSQFYMQLSLQFNSLSGPDLEYLSIDSYEKVWLKGVNKPSFQCLNFNIVDSGRLRKGILLVFLKHCLQACIFIRDHIWPHKTNQLKLLDVTFRNFTIFGIILN